MSLLSCLRTRHLDNTANPHVPGNPAIAAVLWDTTKCIFFTPLSVFHFWLSKTIVWQNFNNLSIRTSFHSVLTLLHFGARRIYSKTHTLFVHVRSKSSIRHRRTSTLISNVCRCIRSLREASKISTTIAEGGKKISPLETTHSTSVPTVFYITLYINIGFGGLGVACWPLVPKFTGSNPAEAVGFLVRKKSSARLPSEGK